MKPFSLSQLLFLLILAVALFLNLRGFDSLIPYFIHLDEAKVIKSALRILQTGDLNPHFFKYGGLPVYLAAGIYSLYFHVWALISGREVSELMQGFFYENNGFALFYLGRSLSLFFGLLSVGMVYAIGRRWFSRKIALWSALFLAISPLHVDRSQIFNVDVIVTFWVLSAFYWAMRWKEENRLGYLLGSAAAAGLAMATKYNFPAFLPILAAEFVRARERGERFFPSGLGKICLAGYVSLLTFFLASPFNFIDFSGFVEEMSGFFSFHQMSHYHYYFQQLIYHRFIYQIFLLFPLVFGPALYLASLGGAIVWARREWKSAFIFISFPLGYFLVGGGAMLYQFPNYFEPLLPFASIIGSFFMAFLISDARKLIRAIGVSLLSFSLIFSFSDLVLPHYRSFSALHRELGDWVKEQARKPDVVLLAGWFFPPSRYLQELGLKRLNQIQDLDECVVIVENPEYIISLGLEAYGSTTAQIYGFEQNWLVHEKLLKGKYKYRTIKIISPPKIWSELSGLLIPLSRDYKFVIFQKTGSYSQDEKIQCLREKLNSGKREEIEKMVKLLKRLKPESRRIFSHGYEKYLPDPE